LVQRIIRHAGWTEARAVSNADEVWEALEAVRPELVLLDLDLPGSDELLVRLSVRLIRRSLPPVLAFTARTDCTPCRRALALGAQDCLRAPLDAQEVALRARNLMRARSLQLRLEGENRRLRAVLAALQGEDNGSPPSW
jgi:DNA-binding response OmpR family regulator